MLYLVREAAGHYVVFNQLPRLKQMGGPHWYARGDNLLVIDEEDVPEELPKPGGPIPVTLKGRP